MPATLTAPLLTPEQVAFLHHRCVQMGQEAVEYHMVTTDDMAVWINPPEWAGVGVVELTFRHGGSYDEGYLATDGRWFRIT